jgi:N-acetylglucosamine kinase-like BadF-type ATPase
MAYYIGIDGGASKTRGLLANASGEILADYTGTGSNYQVYGVDASRSVIALLINQLLSTSNLLLKQIDYIQFALAGADLEDDFCTLHQMVAPIVGSTPYEIVNDAWGLQRSGLKQKWGGVSIYGTGANAGVLSPQGKRCILRALSYAAGGDGGGNEMAIEALHFMFRADELTYTPTLLTSRLPKLLGFNSPAHMIPSIFPHEKLTRNQLNQIPPLVFELANEGDIVCREILSRHGETHGQMLSGVIRQSKTQDLPLPIVLGGSVYNGSNPTFINAMKAEVLKIAPQATFIQSHYPPVVGALFMAMENTGMDITDDVYAQVDGYFSKR